MITNEHLADLIAKIDPISKQWVYNRHCGYCGRFMYVDEVKCKKCRTAVCPILRPIPFSSSATAIEKLLIWLRNTQRVDLLNLVIRIITEWARSDQDAETYRLQIVIEVDRALGREIQ